MNTQSLTKPVPRTRADMEIPHATLTATDMRNALVRATVTVKRSQPDES